MNIRIPPSIQKGCTIGVTAPSFGCTTEPYISRFKCAKTQLESAGYKISAGETVFKSDGKGISTDPRTAARELEEFYCSGSNSAVISAGGGELMCETAGFIDFEKIAAAPAKWFMGYSDNTNFIFPLVTKCGVAAIYGPTITGFGKKWQETELYSIGLLEGKIKETSGFEKFQLPENDNSSTEKIEEQTYCLTEKKIIRLFPQENEQVHFSGILLGGCLDVLANLCGTHLDCMKEFNKNSGPVIWILESCDGNPAEIRRQIWHLKSADWFENAAGFLVGRPLASLGKTLFGIDQYNAVTDILADLEVPIVMDADIGHVDPVVPIAMGLQAEVSADRRNFKIQYDRR
ncbi:LD-carboxypeptidase [Treponema sp.]|uniref:LD-carboxypeptidase n=1 Tax=Treponema sp. TaxID=166 RepID=UPI003F029523